MTPSYACRRAVGRAPRHRHCALAFSLVELLTVIFIISLLIGILIPSLGAARNAAKKSKTNSDIRAIGTAIELFKNDNEREFPHTNGYPPSFAHPPIKGYSFDAHLGQFPFLEDVSDSNPPVVYGAHWLPPMLMGVDNLGYVKRSSVPPSLRSRPWRWYSIDPHEDGEARPLPRAQFYIEPDGVKTVLTQNLRGRRPPQSQMETLFPDWDNMKDLPVMVDAFDQPILYYVANKHGRSTNMAADVRDENNLYTGGEQEQGPPYYFHQDNLGFTGAGSNDPDEITGWNFGGGEHAIARSGHDLRAPQLLHPDGRETFAHFIMDPAQRRSFEMRIADEEVYPPGNTLLKPVNPDSFLLISAGVDGRYGTKDDVANFPLSAE